MEDDGRATLPRCIAVWLAATAAALALGVWLLPDIGDAHRALTGSGHRGPTFDQLLLWPFTAAALAGVGWLWALTTVVTLQAARGHCPGPAGAHGVPAGVRRLVLAACGVALAGGLPAPAALATPGQLHQDQAGASTSATRIPGSPAGSSWSVPATRRPSPAGPRPRP